MPDTWYRGSAGAVSLSQDGNNLIVCMFLRTLLSSTTTEHEVFLRFCKRVTSLYSHYTVFPSASEWLGHVHNDGFSSVTSLPDDFGQQFCYSMVPQFSNITCTCLGRRRVYWELNSPVALYALPIPRTKPSCAQRPAPGVQKGRGDWKSFQLWDSRGSLRPWNAHVASSSING